MMLLPRYPSRLSYVSTGRLDFHLSRYRSFSAGNENNQELVVFTTDPRTKTATISFNSPTTYNALTLEMGFSFRDQLQSLTKELLDETSSKSKEIHGISVINPFSIFTYFHATFLTNFLRLCLLISTDCYWIRKSILSRWRLLLAENIERQPYSLKRRHYVHILHKLSSPNPPSPYPNNCCASRADDWSCSVYSSGL